MRKKILLTMLCLTLFISSCTSNSKQTSPVLQTTTPTPLDAITITPTINTELPAYTKTTLEIIREGKIYSVLLGYDHGEAFWYATPRPNMANWYGDTPNVRIANLERYGDFDFDGENEYFVSIYGRGAKAYTVILSIDYDTVNDEYIITDEIGFAYPVEWDDLETDGIPEIIAKDEKYISRFSSNVFAPILILRYDGEKFISVTHMYPDLIEIDANHWLDMIDNDAHGQGQFDSIYAAYLADMYLLDKKEEGIVVFTELCEDRLIPHIKIYNADTTFNCDEFLGQVQESLLEYGYD